MTHSDQGSGGSSAGRRFVRSDSSHGKSPPATKDRDCRGGLPAKPRQDLPRSSDQNPGIRWSLCHHLGDPVHIHAEVPQERLGQVKGFVPGFQQAMLEFHHVLQPSVRVLTHENRHPELASRLPAAWSHNDPTPSPTLVRQQAFLFKQSQGRLHRVAAHSQLHRQTVASRHHAPPRAR